MLNKIWFGLLLIGLVYGLAKSAWKATHAPPPSSTAPATQPAENPFSQMGLNLTTSAIGAAEKSVELAIGLIGAMAFWLGFMKIAEDAGLIQLIARALRPILTRLFPEIPKDHPAGGAIIMNFAANMLGLDNAATPLGLKAMKELESLNPHPGTATNSMAMFLAINTGCLTLIPFTAIAYRVSMHSKDPMAPIVAMFLATCCTTIAAVISARLLQRFYPPPKLDASGNTASGDSTTQNRSEAQ